MLLYCFGAAIVGAAVWGLAVAKLELRIGYLAWLIGVLAGLAALAGNDMKRHARLVAPAIGAALFGYVLGKFLTIYFILADTTSLGEIVRLYWMLIKLDYDAKDLLFAALAAFAAWRFTRPNRSARPAVAA